MGSTKEVSRAVYAEAPPGADFVPHRLAAAPTATHTPGARPPHKSNAISAG